MLIPYRLNKITLIFILAVLSCMLFGCGVDEEKKGIYDSEKRIAEEGDSFFFSNRTGKADGKHIDMEYKMFYGVKVLWVIEAEDNSEIELSYDLQVKEGEFKIVLVTPKAEIINIAEQSKKGSFNIDASEGKYSIKIVGRKAAGNIQIDLVSHEGRNFNDIFNK